MHHYARGVPKLREPDFYKCKSCALCKIKKDSSTSTRATRKEPLQPTEKLHVGQHLHMDFGFLRGSAFSKKDDAGRTITSIDGFRSYLIVVDRASRYKWVFLTKTKHPPLKEVETILKQYQSITDTLHCSIRTDQGGELGKSNAFRELVHKYGYAYEPTGTNSSKQNGMAEKPNQDLKRITKCLLHAAGLDLSHWSYALNHAVYLSNCLYHSTIKMSPYQAMHNRQPNLSGLKIFGSKCFYKHTKTNQKDLDITGEEGIFLGYTATDKNIYVKSKRTRKIHIALHKSFDEAGVTMEENEKTPMTVALQRAGYNNSCSNANDEIVHAFEETLKVQMLSEDGKSPDRSTPKSAGLDIYSTINAVILPGENVIIPTDIAIETPERTYAQICTRSSFAAKGCSVLGGVIDPDYRGNIKVILQNNGQQPIEIMKHQRVAQLVVKQISMPSVTQVQQLSTTEQNQQGFGSTEARKPHTSNPSTSDISYPTKPTVTVMDVEDFGFDFTTNPFENEIEITIESKGDHPTLGLDIAMNEKFEKVQILSCQKGTPAGKIE